MASFTGVGDNVTLAVPAKGEEILVSISGTYDMTIALQKEMGSPGSGAYQDIKVFNTEDATESYTHITARKGERLRLIVMIDGGGTAVSTLADASDLILKQWYNSDGTVAMTLRQSGLTVTGTLDADTLAIVAGMVLTGPLVLSDVVTGPAPINTTVALVLTQALHAGRVVTLNHATGFAVTLPEAVGNGDVYEVFIGTTVGTGNMTVIAPSGDTSFVGGISMSTDILGVNMLCPAATDTVTMNGTTKGGVVGSFLRFTDVEDGIFRIEGFLVTTGVEASPFSAAI